MAFFSICLLCLIWTLPSLKGCPFILRCSGNGEFWREFVFCVVPCNYEVAVYSHLCRGLYTPDRIEQYKPHYPVCFWVYCPEDEFLSQCVRGFEVNRHVMSAEDFSKFLLRHTCHIWNGNIVAPHLLFLSFAVEVCLLRRFVDFAFCRVGITTSCYA